MYLIKPSIEFENDFRKMVSEWEQVNEKITPPLFFDTQNFDDYIFKINNSSIEAQKGFVKHSTYWLLNNESKIVGTVNIRHNLNDGLKVIGGHIGYGIRPSERQKGHGKKILELALLKAKELNIQKALITCDKDNTGSVKIIEANGGSLWNEDIFEGTEILRYWINVK